MKFSDLIPLLGDLRRVRNTLYPLKEEVRILKRRVEDIHKKLVLAKSQPLENLRRLAARHPDALRALKPGALCLDCGAHGGYVSEVFLKLGATVHAFEPHPVLAAYMRYRLSDYVQSGRLHVHESAVADQDIRLPLQILEPLEETNLYGGKSESSTTVQEKQTAQAAPGQATEQPGFTQTIDVLAVDLAAFIRGLNQRVTLLKVDIEGAEYAVLTHLIRSGAHELCDHILVETHHEKIPALRPQAEALQQLITQHRITHIALDWV